MLLPGLILTAVFMYLVVGGAAGWRVRMRLMASCSDCRIGRMCVDGHQIGFPLLIGAFWPFTGPVAVGAGITHYVSGREARSAKKEQRKQAEHERRMKELALQHDMTMESVRFLVENGIKADVPGLYEVKD